MRKVYFSLLWYALGIITATAGWVYFSSLPGTTTVTYAMPAPPPSTIRPGLALFDYTYPKAMTVGDVGHIRMHVTNLHLAFHPTAAILSPPIPVAISVRPTSNCKVSENTVWPGFKTVSHVLAPIDVPTAFDWTVSATGPGECNIEFTSQIGNFEEPDSVVIPIHDRWGAPEQATIVGALIVAISGLIGLFFTRSKQIVERPREPAAPSIVLEARDHWQVEFGSLETLAIKPARDGSGIVGGLILDRPSSPPPGPRSATGEYPPPSRLLLEIKNIGETTAVGLRIPLRLSFWHLAQDPANAGDPETLGLRQESINHVVDLPLSSLAPGSRQIFIVNETGVTISIESTGEVFDRPPGAELERRLTASSPTTITLPAFSQ